MEVENNSFQQPHLLGKAAAKATHVVPSSQQPLVVPASAWNELQQTVKDLQRQLQETKRYTRAVLKIELVRQERAVVKI